MTISSWSSDYIGAVLLLAPEHKVRTRGLLEWHWHPK